MHSVNGGVMSRLKKSKTTEIKLKASPGVTATEKNGLGMR
jgi:hypothetical protein